MQKNEEKLIATYTGIFLLEGHTTWRIEVIGKDFEKAVEHAREVQKRSRVYRLFELNGRTGENLPVDYSEE